MALFAATRSSTQRCRCRPNHQKQAHNISYSVWHIYMCITHETLLTIKTVPTVSLMRLWIHLSLIYATMLSPRCAYVVLSMRLSDEYERVTALIFQAVLSGKRNYVYLKGVRDMQRKIGNDSFFMVIKYVCNTSMRVRFTIISLALLLFPFKIICKKNPWRFIVFRCF